MTFNLVFRSDVKAIYFVAIWFKLQPFDTELFVKSISFSGTITNASAFNNFVAFVLIPLLKMGPLNWLPSH